MVYFVYWNNMRVNSIYYSLGLLLLLAINPVRLIPATNKYPKNIDNLVVIGLDGMKEEDIRSPYTELLFLLKAKGYFTYWYGKSHNCVTSQPYNISLPAYANFFTGTVDPRITTNSFTGKLKKQTLFDNYKNSQLFSSWDPLKVIMSNNKKLVDEHGFIVSSNGFPRSPDDWVIKEAFLEFYLGSEFSFVHFGDADNYAHLRNYIKYRQSINLSAKYSLEIINHVEHISDSGKAFIFFSDHSRGRLLNWHSHGKHLPESKHIFILIASTLELNFTLPICDHTALHGIIKSIIPK